MKVTDDRLLEEIARCKEYDAPTYQLFDFCHQLIIQYLEKAQWKEQFLYADYTGTTREQMISHAAWNMRRMWEHFDLERFNNPIAYANSIIRCAIHDVLTMNKK